MSNNAFVTNGHCNTEFVNLTFTHHGRYQLEDPHELKNKFNMRSVFRDSGLSNHLQYIDVIKHIPNAVIDAIWGTVPGILNYQRAQ